MVFNLIDKEDTLSGKGFNFSLFGLKDAKQDKKIFEELGKIFEEDGKHATEYTEKIKELSAASRETAEEIKKSSTANADLSQGFLNAAKSADKMKLSSRAAAVGMKVLSTAMNMLVGMGIG